MQLCSSGMIWTISPANWPLELGSWPTYKYTRNYTYLGLKNNWGMQSKMVLKICEGISCSSFYVKEFDVIVHKKYFPCITLLNSAINFAILYLTALANLEVKVETRHSHQILFIIPCFYPCFILMFSLLLSTPSITVPCTASHSLHMVFLC